MKHLIKIAVSGAANTEVCGPHVADLAFHLGEVLVDNGCAVVTGATSGVPLWVAKGAKSRGGTVVGFSPALNEKEHLYTFALPTQYHDLIFWTGLDYTGRDMMLSRVAEGVIIICGRIGTVNEFTIAFEDKKPIGVITGSGGNSDELRVIVEKSGRTHPGIVWDPNPDTLVPALLKIIRNDDRYIHEVDFEKV